MARGKLNLAYIDNDAQRKATFKKRRKGLIKKASELKTLCGIDACVVIESEYENQPEEWPNVPEVHRLINKVRSLPEIEQRRKMFNNERIINERLEKGNAKMMKQFKENRENQVALMMNDCLAEKGRVDMLMMPDLVDLVGVIDKEMKSIGKKLEGLKITPVQGGGSSQPAPQNAELQPIQEETQGAELVAAEGSQTPQFVTDWMNATDDQTGFGFDDDAMLQFMDPNYNVGVGPSGQFDDPNNDDGAGPSDFFP